MELTKRFCMVIIRVYWLYRATYYHSESFLKYNIINIVCFIIGPKALILGTINIVYFIIGPNALIGPKALILGTLNIVCFIIGPKALMLGTHK